MKRAEVGIRSREFVSRVSAGRAFGRRASPCDSRREHSNFRFRSGPPSSRARTRKTARLLVLADPVQPARDERRVERCGNGPSGITAFSAPTRIESRVPDRTATVDHVERTETSGRADTVPKWLCRLSLVRPQGKTDAGGRTDTRGSLRPCVRLASKSPPGHSNIRIELNLRACVRASGRFSSEPKCRGVASGNAQQSKARADGTRDPRARTVTRRAEATWRGESAQPQPPQATGRVRQRNG